jgi:hypothetical protein
VSLSFEEQAARWRELDSAPVALELVQAAMQLSAGAAQLGYVLTIERAPSVGPKSMAGSMFRIEVRPSREGYTNPPEYLVGKCAPTQPIETKL